MGLQAITDLRRALVNYAMRRGKPLPTGGIDELAACAGIMDHLIEDLAPDQGVREDLTHAKRVVEMLLAGANPASTGDTQAGMRVRFDALARGRRWIDSLPDLPPASD